MTWIATVTRMAAVLIALCSAVFIAATHAQAPQMARFGSVASSLSDEELTQVTDLAAVAGKKPWLTLGFRSMSVGVAALTIFLEPDVTTERLSRGRILRLTAQDTPAVPQRSRWSGSVTGNYAYVPIAGRSREIADDTDLSWPFEVSSEIDDETLVSLVTFVRSRPPIPGVADGHEPQVVVSAPLSFVGRRNGEFIVAFRTFGGAGAFRVGVAKKDGKWLVTRWDASVA